MFKKIFSLLIISTVITSSGCAVVMAAKQPDKKNLNMLAYGMPRASILAEFGAPVSSEKNKEGNRVDVFAFTQGYDKATKFARTVFHSAADIATLGLWEVAGTPIEGSLDGTQLAYQVTYNNDRVIEVVQLKK